MVRTSRRGHLRGGIVPHSRYTLDAFPDGSGGWLLLPAVRLPPNGGSR